MSQNHQSIDVTWLGTAGVLLEDGETGFLIDPYVSRFGMLKIALGLPLPPDTIKRIFMKEAIFLLLQL